MPAGKVKFYNQKSRFGFIKVDDSGNEIYVRASGLIDIIAEGDNVSFDIKDGRKGPEAVNVKKTA